MTLNEYFNTIDPRTGQTFAQYATERGMSWESMMKGFDYVERKKAEGHDFNRGTNRSQSKSLTLV